MKRMARRAIEATVPILGILIILSSVLLNPNVTVQLHVTVLLIGVLILLTGPPWELRRAILPDERVDLELREEVDHFLQLMRSLKQSPDELEDGQEQSEFVLDTVEKMRTSVDRIAELADEGQSSHRV
jgi:hypothetical protein